MKMTPPPNLKTLLAKIREDVIDTVLLVFPDMQGRWMGKRVTGKFFAESAAKDGVHACSYLLTVNMEMDPLPGFKLTSWEQGYQDFHMVPDFETVRYLPWAEKTALVICDLYSEAGRPVDLAPPWILKNQLARARKLGFTVKTASELEFYLFKETYETAKQKDFHHLTPYGAYIEDYHILQGAREEFFVRDVRNMMQAAGVPVESSKGEWGRGQHEINLGYTEALEMADRHTVYKHGAKEIAMSKGVAITFMAKYDAKCAGSSFHLHSSLWDTKTGESSFWRDGGLTKTFTHYLGGQMTLAKDFALFYAPTVNSYKRYQAGTFAPTKITWGKDNRTCGLRVVGEGPSYRVENRIPGADANPYLAFAATIAAGLYGISNKTEPSKECVGNAYETPDIPEVPKSLTQAIAALQRSATAREAFGDAVIEHYLHAASLEQAAYQQSVTCWELERNFERI